MRGGPDTIRADIDALLRPIGLTWHAIEQRASQVVLFGSRAAGVAGENSDWDLLIVGKGKAVHTRELDLIWVAPDTIRSARWLGSELASHVAVYGRWLLGPDEWRSKVRISRATVRRKQAAVEFQLQELSMLWSALLPPARARHVARLRRDVQRLELLRNGRAVPPSYHLDVAWKRSGVPAENLRDLETVVRSQRP